MIDIATINAKDLKVQWDLNPNLCLIDVREASERATSCISGTLHIPINNLLQHIEKQVPNLDQTVYLHCKSGMRSLVAAKTLMELGYKQVYSLAGGILAWIQLGYPVKNDNIK